MRIFMLGLLLAAMIIAVQVAIFFLHGQSANRSEMTEEQREATYQAILAKRQVMMHRREQTEAAQRAAQAYDVTPGSAATIMLQGIRHPCRVMAACQTSPPVWWIRFDDGRISQALTQELIMQVEQ